MKTLQPPGNSTQHQSASAPTNNFAKALFEAGGNLSQNDGQSQNDSIASFLSANPSLAQNFPNPQNFPSEQGFNLDNPWMNPEDQEKEQKKRELRLLRHREVNQVEVFDRRQIETDKKIQQIIEQLEALTKDLDKADAEARAASIAVMQAPTKGGEYHVTFFEKLLKTIILLRQRVQKSSSWLHTLNSRQEQQKSYWGQFYANGTQWAMSGERSLATSVG